MEALERVPSSPPLYLRISLSLCERGRETSEMKYSSFDSGNNCLFLSPHSTAAPPPSLPPSDDGLTVQLPLVFFSPPFGERQ